MAISGVSQSSVTKMGKNENVNTAIEEHNAWYGTCEELLEGVEDNER
jgi:hypothetical protein